MTDFTKNAVGEHSEFRTRLEHIEECLKKLESDVEVVKSSGSINWPRIDRMEADIRRAEKELSMLQGQGAVHSVRLDGIERSLNGLRDDIKQFHESMHQIAKEQRDALLQHTSIEEAWQRKMLFGIVTTLIGVVLSLGATFILKFVHP